MGTKNDNFNCSYIYCNNNDCNHYRVCRKGR